MLAITSSTNDKFKLWKSLLSSKGIKKEKLFLLSGEKIIREFLRSSPKSINGELVPARGQPLLPQSHPTSHPASHPVFELSKELFAELDELGTHFNLLVVMEAEIPRWNSKEPAQGLEIFCPLGDPSNVGALIRSAEAFSADKIILTTEAAHPFLPKAVKASAGSVLRAPIFWGPSLDQLPADIHALDKGGTALSDFTFPKNFRLLVGEEGQGLKNFSGKNKISIATHGVESLNAVVAASIALYEHRKQNGPG